MTTAAPIRAAARALTLACSAIAATLALAQGATPLAPPPNGPRTAEPTKFVLRGATVHAAPGSTIENAAVLVDAGQIRMVMPVDAYDRQRSALGLGATPIDVTGQHLYPGFLDAWVEVDAPTPASGSPGAHWSGLVTPQRSALAGEGLSADDAKKLRGSGVVAAGIVPKGGLFMGDAAVVSTAEPIADPSRGRPPVYRADAFAAMDFRTNGWGSNEYPGSGIGAVALIRQTMLDAQARQRTPGPDASSLDAVALSGPIFFNADSALETLLIDRIAREFALDQAVIVGHGREFERLDAVAATKRAMIVPLRFPAKPKVGSVGEADAATLSDMLAWEQAPTNPRRLAEAGLTVAITTGNLPKGAKFFDNLRRAITEGGLTEDAALAMLTSTPAKLLGVEKSHGSVEPGKTASFFLTDKPLFTDDKAKILDLYIDGRRHRLADAADTRFDGTWRFLVGEPDAPVFEARLTIDGSKIQVSENFTAEKPTFADARAVVVDGPGLSFLFDQNDDDRFGTYVISGTLLPDRTIRGTGLDTKGAAFAWTGLRLDEPARNDDADKDDENKDAADSDKNDAKKKEPKAPEPAPASLGGAPFGPYSLDTLPPQSTVLFTNATVWTSGPAGVIDNGFVLISGGTVAAVGPMPASGTPSAPAGATIIDASGKHITPGLIDAHSHTGLRFGVNESGQAVTAEVRIADALDPTHINWYRELAGGLTVANLLHGSANPIGGQSQTVKLRWGQTNPADWFFASAKPGIKFALGENVKQSNWGDDNTTRYPQTRLGVETLIRDRFVAAREYLNNGRKLPDGRRDLELDALAEILAGQRLVHCHSYRQDEILMLCRIAEEFGFKIGTFQHGLEVYKVAEAVKKNAIGASLFSDWWAYKVEVQDAIPYAGPIQHEVGLLTSYNSDSDELARRMNLEAAKALRYAQQSGIAMTPAQALHFVTINPAIQLGIDSATGSLDVGKDADLVLWSGDPLSTMARAERTFVDGRELFSLEADAAHRERIRAERQRLVQKILGAPDRPEDEAAGDEDADETPEQRRFRRFLAQQDEHGMTSGDCGCHAIHLADELFTD